MRLQLIRAARVSAASAAIFFAAASAHAQVAEVETAHTLYLESPTRTKMTVYTPSLDVSATPVDWMTIKAGYEADIVSGASVAVKAGPAYAAVNPGADVISTASVHDFRQSPSGSVTLRKGDVAYTAQYNYGTENDYKSHSIFVAARTDAYEHNTQFELSYARNFDLVCDRVQGVNTAPPRHFALDSSEGCFGGGSAELQAITTRHTLAIDGLQAGWSQSWTPEFVTQLTYTAQILNGFQSNPYRSVILGQGLKTQEHHPENRARQAVAGRANYYIRPLKLALRIGVRIYRDTWDITSGTGDAEVERYLFEGFRIAARFRYYRQTGASFWSDDYTGGDLPLGPKGQYWTGDRELSPFSSVTVGGRITYATQPRSGRYLGFISGVKAGAAIDVVQFDYSEYTLGGTPVSGARAFILGANATASF